MTPQLEFSHAGPVVSFPPPQLRLILPWSPSSCLPMLTCSCHLCTLTPELCHTARGFAVCCSPRQPPIDGVILDQRTTSPSFVVAALQRLHVVHITSGYGSLQNEKQPRNRQDCETRSSACEDPKRVLFVFFLIIIYRSLCHIVNDALISSLRMNRCHAESVSRVPTEIAFFQITLPWV